LEWPAPSAPQYTPVQAKGYNQAGAPFACKLALSTAEENEMSFLAQGTAVITGAGSGIGRALAQRLARAGASLALADINESSLRETISSLGAAEVTAHAVDVSSEAAVRDFANAVKERHRAVTILVNNAGVALLGGFEQISLDDFRWLMDINFWGVVYGVHYFLPLLKTQPRAHIVNISSVFGLVAPAGQSAYSASKFAIRGFSEVLGHELEGTNVFMTCVHPGGIATSVARSARLGKHAPESLRTISARRFAELAKILPDTAAARILEGVEKRETRVLIGSDAKAMDVLQRLRPATYWKSLSKRYKVK
jgi:NAD(P)-dependent dehydrogenase (short-subunit alcohol dehydrogenase family)